MISNQIMQNTIEGIKAIARVELFVADVDGKLVASTRNMGNNFESSVLEFVKSAAFLALSLLFSASFLSLLNFVS